MTKVDDPRLPGWDEPPLPLNSRSEKGKRPHVRQLSLIHIMVLVVYCAVLFWLVKQIVDTDGYVPKIVTGVVVGLGFCGLGLWAAMKLARFSVIGWILFVIGYMVITLSTSGPFAILTLPFLIGAIIFLCLRRHANNQDALLWVLDVASDRGIPLAPGVQAFSGQVAGMYGVWTASLADLLRRGVPLPDALDNIPKLVPRRSALMVRMGWESSNLPLGLKEASAARETRQPVLQAIGGQMTYIGWVLTIGSGIVGFILYYIVPRFEAIFKDFGLDLPRITKFVIIGSHFLVDYAWLGTIAVLGAIIYALVAVLGTDDLGIPIFDRLFPRRHMIVILRALAIVVSAGKPIPQALYVLSHSYPTDWVRKRLNQSAEDANLGIEWTEALCENGLLSSSDVGVIISAQRAGNLEWALRELAETGERRLAYRLQAWSYILFILTMLVLGSLVFILAVAFMLPLITLIERLAS
jgi:type II secretory pathway component PulF